MALSSIVCEGSTEFWFDAVRVPQFTRRSPPRRETSAKNTLRQRLLPRASLFAYFYEVAGPACACTFCSLHMVLLPKSLFLLFNCRATRLDFPLAVSINTLWMFEFRWTQNAVGRYVDQYLLCTVMWIGMWTVTWTGNGPLFLEAICEWNVVQAACRTRSALNLFRFVFVKLTVHAWTGNFHTQINGPYLDR